MANYPYKRPGTQLDDFRETIIEFQIAVEQDIRSAKGQIDKLIVEGDSSPQAAAAAVDATGKAYKTLKERLDAEQTVTIQAKEELKESLSDIEKNKVDKQELEALDTKISKQASGSPKGTYPTLAALQAAFPNGNNNIYIVSANGNWYYWNNTTWTAGGVYQAKTIGKNEINAGMIDFIKETSSNLFDKTKVTKGFTINTTTGGLYASTTNSVSDFISIKTGTQYVGFPIARKAFYDINQVYISSDTVAGPFTPPENAAFMRVVVDVNFLEFARLNVGDTLRQHEDYYQETEKIKFHTKNLIGKDVKPEHVSFIEESSNLFNKNKLTHGYSLSTEGAMVANASTSVSEFIPIKSDTIYSMANIARVNIYDINGVHLMTVAGQSTFTTNSRSYYARFVAYTINIEKAQVNKGEALLPYESGLFSIKDLKVTEDNLEVTNISKEQTDFIEESTNLFNKDLYTLGYNISNSNGALTESVGHRLSNKMFIKPGEKLTGNIIQKYAFYSKEGNWIINIYPVAGPPETSTVTAPANSYYAIGVYSTSEYNYNAQVNEGDKLLSYERYYTIVNGSKIIDQETINETIQETKYSKSAISKRDKYVIVGDLDKTYSGPVLPDYLSLVSSKTTDIIALYDELVSKYPHYIKKSLFGKNSLGQDIFQYDFIPGKVDTVGTETKLPKMILISGVHPEKAGVYALYQAMKQTCENWKNNESLEVLRWNVHFIVVPVVNIYGYDNNTRRNHNGVDLARNSEKGWYLGNPTDQTYGGPEPLSEMETRLLDGLLNANQDAIFFTSFHNFWSDEKPHYFIWNAAASQLQVNIAKQLISKMSRKWKQEYKWLPQDETTFFGHAGLDAPAGSEGRQAVEKYGIQGGTFEVCADVMLESGHKTYNSLALTLGLETFVNFLLLNLKHNVEFYNDKL